VRRGARTLLAQGATEIYVCSKDPSANLCYGQGEGYRLEFRHDMLQMERTLPAAFQPGRLVLEPLSREKCGAWLAIYNESFFDVPNSATYGQSDLAQALEAGACGFAMLNSVPIGIYELSFAKPHDPEINGISLLKGARCKGLGRELLYTVMDLLAGKGYGRVSLKVSTANESAYALYRSAGFTITELLSHWYEVISEGDLGA
jgi:ribosomal protein S18 acetylase RimI-like enzyme